MGLKTARPSQDIPLGALRRAAQLQRHNEEDIQLELNKQMNKQLNNQESLQLHQQGPSPVDHGASPDAEALPPLPLPPAIIVNRNER